jgi:hypothetical protein
MTYLSLVNCDSLDDEDLAQLPCLPKLQALDVSDSHISDRSATSLAVSKDLRYLRVEGNCLSDTFLEEIAHLPRLDYLNVKKTNVTAAGVANFRRSRPEVQLESSFPRVVDEW